MESFCSALKSELVHHRRFSTREQARREIDEYLEIIYNRIRQQARLGYLYYFESQRIAIVPRV